MVARGDKRYPVILDLVKECYVGKDDTGKSILVMPLLHYAARKGELLVIKFLITYEGKHIGVHINHTCPRVISGHETTIPCH